MRNNKGQVLAVFVILIPILLMIFTFVIDLGLMSIEKRNITNEVKSTLKYGLKNIDSISIKNDLQKLLLKNIENLNSDDIDIEINNNYIKISVKKEYKKVFNIISNNDYIINITYSGNVSNDKIVITKG